MSVRTHLKYHLNVDWGQDWRLALPAWMPLLGERIWLRSLRAVGAVRLRYPQASDPRWPLPVEVRAPGISTSIA